MAASEVAICNLALQKLGAGSIAALADDSTNALACNACYAHIRDSELRRHDWNFARKRTTLAPSTVEPDHEFDYAFPVPSDFLALRPPAVNGLDWRLESHDGATAILTNDGDTLEIVYTARITDTARFDDSFTEMVAARMADHMCEKITGSNAKRAQAKQDYKDARAEARRNNAFENVSQEPPEDPWVAARR
jgi:hypothetical protein